MPRRADEAFRPVRKMVGKIVNTLLADEAAIPVTTTLPVEGLVHFFDALEAYDAFRKDTQRLLFPDTEERLRTILHNSRIVEGFLDDVGGESEDSEEEVADDNDENAE